MAKRTRSSQSKHDREVRRIAEDLKGKGFDVKADVKGYPRPSTISGFRPDVDARKGKQRKVVEVETSESVGSARDLKQKQAFKGAAKNSKNTSFSRSVVNTRKRT